MMNQNKLIENIIDQIKEVQIKIGYAKETIRLYYPVTSLNTLLGIEAKNTEEFLQIVKTAFLNTVLGEITFCAHGDRIEVKISPKGAEYVYREIPEPKFLKKMIELFGAHHHCSLEDVKHIFSEFSENYVCEKIPEDMGFDYVLYFPDGEIDKYYYCIKEEMEHTIYHRFTREDFMALMG
ncbi:MAG: DUF3877 family protein [Lachnospiraceae bacterium]